ncbi:hypothetical protein [Pseudomonas phage vB_PaeM_PS119XW]|uniref:Uncharacterized protein n=1 Tax=Pseudomonas phage vB_PaeM_PS119XW TaxID=2601632 RepID=A0A5C1K7B2_9CAUD|nr:hypothetical protein PP933_gp041 [Pseudomonas phage vB_PaeM_PS119XW]QEM41770.1 hypothetical protein [Pseudomonas phage vB_PaeM_PS119XW]
MSSKRFVVLEINPQVDVLYTYLEHFTKSNPHLGLPRPTRNTAIQLVFLTVKEILTSRSAFETEIDYEVHKAGALFNSPPGTLDEKQLEVYKIFASDVIWEGVTIEIDNQLEHHIDRRTYTEWKPVCIGNLIGLAEGEDHRIQEYYRLTDQHNDDSHAEIALNCTSLVSYLHGEFMRTFGAVMRDPNTLTRAIAMMGKHRTPERVQKVIDFLNNPNRAMAAVFLDTLTTMYPMITLDPICPQVNDDLFALVGIANMEEFKQNYVRKVITAFGLSYFSSYVKRDKKYTLEYSSSHILAIYEMKGISRTEKEMMELVASFLRNDYLPPEQRAIAERWYLENN